MVLMRIYPSVSLIQKRNEDPYLVRVLEPRRKTPHTQRCNEFPSRRSPSLDLRSELVPRLRYVTRRSPQARAALMRPRRASRSRRPRPRGRRPLVVPGVRTTACGGPGVARCPRKCFTSTRAGVLLDYVPAARAIPCDVRLLALAAMACGGRSRASSSRPRRNQHAAASPVRRGGTPGPAPGARPGRPSASLPHKPSFWPRRHHPVEPSLFGGQAAGTPCSPQFEFPARRARRPAAPASGRSGRASASARRATAAACAARS